MLGIEAITATNNNRNTHTMKNFTQLLTKLHSDIKDASDRHELSDLEETLEAINGELDHGTAAEFALYNKCEAEVAKASRFLADEYAQEERDEMIDQMRYESFRSQR